MKNVLILLLTLALACMMYIACSIPRPTFDCYEDQYKATDINGRELCIDIDKVMVKH